MKYLLLLPALFFVFSATSQVIDDENGKTYYYYDSLTHKRVKEIYHHKMMVKIMPDPKKYGNYLDTILHIRNGPYTRYYETGQLECSGYFRDEKKDSIWKFYNLKGVMVRTERWVNGEKIK